MTTDATMMRAAVWQGAGQPLEVKTIPRPSPSAGEVRIRVAACGVCHSDLHVLLGEVAFPAPGVIGHEVSGVVDAAGDGVSEFAPGDRVVGSFIMPCGHCWQCEQGRDDLCETFFAENRLQGNLLDGTSRLSTADGERLSMYSMAGMAEYAIIPETSIARVPDELPLEESAVLGCAGMTAYGAVRAAEQVGPGVAVVVVAVGGVGSSIIQVVKHFGAHPIIAIDVDETKLAGAKAIGADITIDGRDPGLHDIVMEATGGRGARVVFEALGRPQTLEQGLSLLAAGGRMVAVGIADRDAAMSVPITGLVRRAQSVVGSFGGSPQRELPAVVQLAAEGGISLSDTVSARYGLDQVQQAYDDLAARRITGRAIVTMQAD